jgi:hypothetical protein
VVLCRDLGKVGVKNVIYILFLQRRDNISQLSPAQCADNLGTVESKEDDGIGGIILGEESIIEGRKDFIIVR